MNTMQFDDLVQSRFCPGSRRGLLRLLTILPLGGVPAAFLAVGSAADKHHRRTRQPHRDNQHDQLKEQRKKKKKKPCAQAGQATSKKRKSCCTGLVRDTSGLCTSAASPSPPASPPPPPAPGCTPATCPPSACGSVPDGCGGTLSCGGCAGNSICVSGTCQPCDVCPSGCFFSSVQSAVDATSSGETIRLCPGVYPGNITIGQDMTLIGAGDGNGAGNTILQGDGTTSVVRITAVRTISLQDLRVTGGSSDFGGGISHLGRLSLTGCTITGNTATQSGGGIFTSGSAIASLTLSDCSVSGNKAASGGGILHQGGPLALIASTISGNTATQFGGGVFNGGKITLDAASRVTANTANTADSDSGGGILNLGTVTLSGAENVTANTPHNCGGDAVPLCNG